MSCSGCQDSSERREYQTKPSIFHNIIIICDNSRRSSATIDSKKVTRMKQPILFIIAMILAAVFVPVQVTAQVPRSVELEVHDLDAHRFQAMTAADLPALERLLADDLVYTHASGWRQSKAEFLASLRTGELVYHSFASESQQAKVYGGTMLVTGRASGKVRSRGEELNVELLYLEAYVKQDGRWQLAAWESTRVAPAPAPSH